MEAHIVKMMALQLAWHVREAARNGYVGYSDEAVKEAERIVDRADGPPSNSSTAFVLRRASEEFYGYPADVED